jgi:hypothetical protein
VDGRCTRSWAAIGAGVFPREVVEVEEMKMVRYAETTQVRWPCAADCCLGERGGNGTLRLVEGYRDLDGGSVTFDLVKKRELASAVRANLFTAHSYC